MSDHELVAAAMLADLDAGSWPNVYWDGEAGWISLVRGADALPLVSERDALRDAMQVRMLNFSPKTYTVSESTLRAWIRDMVPLAYITPVTQRLGRR